MDILTKAYDPETFRRQGHALIDMLADYLADATRAEPARPVIPWRNPEEELRYWAAYPDNDNPLPFLQQVLDDSIHLHQPRYMGHQVAPPAPLAALAGLVSGLLNNGMAVYEMGAPATAIERLLLQKIAPVLGFDSQADGFLTSGGTLANLSALLAARSRYPGADVWQEGCREPLALMVSEEAHYCVDRAARIMGWGEQGIIKVPVDDQYRMRTELLPALYEQAAAKGITVIAVVGSACTTSTGSFDNLEAIGQFCRQHQCWFHVDGAHGAAMAFSRQHQHVLRGLELADSVTLDFHKMLMTPAITTALVFRQGHDSYHTFRQKAQYLFGEEEDWYNMAKRSFECTKLMMSIKAYILLHTYGTALFEQYIDRVVDNGQQLARLLRERSGWQLAVPPACNIVCFRYSPKGATEADTDALNQRIRKALTESGRFYIVQTSLRGRTWLRVTLTNPFTGIAELQELLDTLETLV
jgi:L-2,4-diaminobutyrate decarboxylase